MELTLTNRELQVIASLAGQNDAAVVEVVEQKLAGPSLAWSSPRRRTYVVTMRMADEDRPTVQLMLVSGPDMDGPIDVVALEPVVRPDTVQS